MTEAQETQDKSGESKESAIFFPRGIFNNTTPEELAAAGMAAKEVSPEEIVFMIEEFNDRAARIAKWNEQNSRGIIGGSICMPNKNE